jgi:hypothetical protein
MKKFNNNQIVCNTLTDVENKINNQISHFSQNVFRGLPDSNYELISSVEQNIKNKDNAINCVKRLSQQLKDDLVQHKMENQIYTDSFNYPKPNYKNEWLFLSQAQHLRIPTMLMDWSIDWKKALFFAVFEMKNLHKSGALWILNSSGISNTFEDDLLGENSIYYANPYNYCGAPRLINLSIDCNSSSYLPMQRIRFQDGRFLITSLKERFNALEYMNDFNNRLTKIEITPNCKMEIMNLYLLSREVPKYIAGLPGVEFIDNKYYGKYDEAFFYGCTDEILEKIINKIRKNEGFA